MLSTFKVTCVFGSFTSAFLLLAVEDATLLQMLTLFLAFLSTTIGSILAFKIAKMNKKVDAVVTDVATVKVHTNQMTTDLAAKSQEAGLAQGKIQERERAESLVAQVALVDAQVDERVRVALADNPPTSVAGSAIEKNVVEVKKTVGVIDENVKDVKGEVLKDVGDVVRDAVKDVTEKPK